MQAYVLLIKFDNALYPFLPAPIHNLKEKFFVQKDLKAKKEEKEQSPSFHLSMISELPAYQLNCLNGLSPFLS